MTAILSNDHIPLLPLLMTLISILVSSKLSFLRLDGFHKYAIFFYYLGYGIYENALLGPLELGYWLVLLNCIIMTNVIIETYYRYK